MLITGPFSNTHRHLGRKLWYGHSIATATWWVSPDEDVVQKSLIGAESQMHGIGEDAFDARVPLSLFEVLDEERPLDVEHAIAQHAEAPQCLIRKLDRVRVPLCVGVDGQTPGMVGVGCQVQRRSADRLENPADPVVVSGFVDVDIGESEFHFLRSTRGTNYKNFPA